MPLLSENCGHAMFIKEHSLETQSVVSNCTCFKFTRKLLVQWTSTVLFFKGESSVALGDCPRVPPLVTIVSHVTDGAITMCSVELMNCVYLVVRD